MAKKLTSLLINQITWRLPFKAFFFAVSLAIVYGAGAAWWSLFLFFVVLLAIYFSDTPERRLMKVSFWLLPLIALSFFHYLPRVGIGPGTPFLLAVLTHWLTVVVIAGGLFFVVLGLNHLIFRNRFLVYTILNTVLMALVFGLYLASGRGLVPSLLLVSVITLFFRAIFDFFGFGSRKQGLVFGLAVGFLMVELAWFLALLPLGLLAVTAYLTLVFSIIRDAFRVYKRGHSDLGFVLREAGFLVIFTALIFSLGRWTI